MSRRKNNVKQDKEFLSTKLSTKLFVNNRAIPDFIFIKPFFIVDSLSTIVENQKKFVDKKNRVFKKSERRNFTKCKNFFRI